MTLIPASRRGFRHLRFFGIAFIAILASSCMSVAERRNLANGYTELGNSFAEQKKWDKAGLAWSRALELDKAQGIAGFNLMRALVEAGKYEEAISRAEVLLKADSENAMVLGIYAYSLYKSGDNAKAIEIYEKAYSLNAGDSLSLFNLAVLYEAAGKSDEAILKYRELVKLDPENENGNIRLGLLLLALSEKTDTEPAVPTEMAPIKEAQIYIELYLGTKPDSIPARKALARIQEKSGAFAKAMETWLFICEKAPTDSLAWFNLARLRLVIADDSVNGLEDLKKALELGFTDESALEKLLAADTLADREEVLKIIEDSKGARDKALEDTALADTAPEDENPEEPADGN